MQSLVRQKGISLIAVAVLAFLVIFFGLIMVKMSGPYMDNWTLDQMINTALEGETAARFNINDFEDRVSKNMSINNMAISFEDAITFDRRSSTPKIVMDYEHRVHFAFNIDVVMVFYKEYEL